MEGLELAPEVLLGTAVAVLVLGILLVSRKRGASAQLSPATLGRCACKLDRASHGGRKSIEPVSDLLRNLGAVRVAVTGKPVKLLQELMPKASAIKSSGVAVSEEVVAQVLEEMDDVVSHEMIGAHKGIAAIVVDLLTVTPSMDCLLDAKMSPPAMFQPLHTLIITKSQVRCMTDGFVGGPTKGPPNPNLKFTDTRMRILSGDAARAAVESSQDLDLQYVIQATKHTLTSQVADATQSLLTSVAASNNSETQWKELLVA